MNKPKKAEFKQSTRKERVSWYFYDWAVSAFTTTVVTVFIGPYLTEITKTAAAGSDFISILGIPVHTGSFFPYIVSLSVLLQVIFLPILGAIADYTNKKKFLLGVFAYIGSIATILLYFLQGDMYIYGGILFLIANLSFGASMVIYNSFLGEIAEADRRDEVSSIGWAVGYLGGGILLAVNLVLFSMAEDFGLTSGEAVRISLTSAGIWWAIFTILPMVYLKTRKGRTKEIPKGQSVVKIGYKQLIKTFKEIRRYPKTLMFLIAYLFYNDGVQAVIALSAQFGKEELGLGMETLTTVILMVQFVAFLGSILFNYLAKVFRTKRAILLSLVIWVGTVFYAYSYLHDEFGFYILGAVIALVLGGTQALSRSLFSLLIPPGKEAEYFGFYEVSERGTSWLGPMVFGLSLQFTGSYRIAILSLGIFFVIGFVLLLTVKIKSAIKEAGNVVPHYY
jgi:MFS transporter, UMF1 family